MGIIPPTIIERILGAASFPDTVAYLVRRKPTNEIFRTIQQLSGGVTCPRPSKKARHAGYKRRLLIQQPRPQLMPLLDEWTQQAREHHPFAGLPDWCLNELHFAVDYLTETRGDAAELQEWFAQHLVELWRREIRVTSFRGTRYTAPDRWRTKGWTIYSDRTSKIEDGQPCCHLEYRARGAGKVRSLGIRRAVDLLDNPALWKRLIVVEEVANVRRIGRQHLGRGRAKKPFIERWGPIAVDMELMIGGRLARIAVAKMGEDYPCAQAVRQINRWFKDVDPRRTTIRMDNAMLIPVPWGCSMIV